MGIQINGQTDTVTSTTAGGSVKVTPLAASTGLNVGTGASISSPATNVLTLGTNNTEVVRIDSSGNVGVNTSTPASKLHVQNGVIVKDQYSDQNSANPGLQLKHNGTIYGSWRHDGRLEIGGQDSNAVIRLNPDGTTGIGTNNPSSMLHLLQSSGNAKITIQRSNAAANTDDYGSILWRSSAANNNGAIGVARESAENNGYMYFNTGSGGTLTERVRIDSSGNVKLSTAGTKVLNSSGNPILQQTGSILQVVQGTKTDSFTTTSTSYTTPTGLSVSITPSSTSSKILVLASISFMISGDSGHAYARLYRDSTSIFNASTAGSRNTATFVQNNSGGNGDQRAAISYIDSPGLISALTYTIQVKSSNGTTVYVNQSPRDNDGTQYDGRSVSSIVVMEVSG